MTNTHSSPVNAVCYVERSAVRQILIGSNVNNEDTNDLLQEVDALPIVTAEDFRIRAKQMPSREMVARIIATELGENFDRLVDEHFEPGFCQEDFYRSADAVLAFASPEPATPLKRTACDACPDPDECASNGCLIHTSPESQP